MWNDLMVSLNRKKRYGITLNCADCLHRRKGTYLFLHIFLYMYKIFFGKKFNTKMGKIRKREENILQYSVTFCQDECIGVA